MHLSRRLLPPSSLPDFASNDYLGLARSPIFLQALQEETARIKRIGSTGSRLLTGNSPYAEELEMRIAAFHGFEAALLFGSGYMANLGLLSALPGPFYYDTHVHLSARDGIYLSRQPAFPVRHNDLNHLEHRLKKKGGFVFVESLYSSDGSLAPLSDLEALTMRTNAHLIVDEAHAVGVCGPSGKGLASPHIFAKVITFSKALGCYGAAVLGSKTLKTLLINRARSCIYSTALPFPLLAAIQTAYDFFPGMEQERLHLHQVQIGPSHIHALPYTDRTPPVNLAHLRPPTVPKEVWRISFHAYNTLNEVRSLQEWIKSL